MRKTEPKLKPIKESINKRDKTRTDTKFSLWNKHCKDISMKLALLQDPTIFSYAYLKDKQGKSLKLRPFQDLLVNDQNQFVVCAASNQIGKTWAAVVKVIHHLLFVPNATVLVCSRNFELSKKILRDVKEMGLRSKIRLADDVDNKCLVTITNWDNKGTSKMVAVPPTASALSYDATLIILDEAAFMENGIYLYQQIFETRIGETQHWEHPFLTLGQIFVISNPNYTQGLLWVLWNDPRYSRYRFDWLVHPKHTKAQFEYWRDTLPTDIFDSCYAAVFSSAAGRFIPAEWYNRACDEYELILPASYPVFFGLDLAGTDVKSRSTDFNVMYGLIVLRREPDQYPKLKVVYSREWRAGTPRKWIFSEIRRMFDNCNFGGIAYDKVGVADDVKHGLSDPTGKYAIPLYLIHGLTYSLSNKSDVYQNLRNLYEFNRLIHPDIPKLRNQLSILDFERTMGSGHIRVKQFRDSIHDDHPDALANACYLATRLSSAKASIQFVGKKQYQEVII